MKYRAVWIAYKNGKPIIHYGSLTSDLHAAIDDVEFHRALDLSAWVQDEENNKVY